MYIHGTYVGKRDTSISVKCAELRHTVYDVQIMAMASSISVQDSSASEERCREYPTGSDLLNRKL